jgi:hypothetical protein
MKTKKRQRYQFLTGKTPSFAVSRESEQPRISYLLLEYLLLKPNCLGTDVQLKRKSSLCNPPDQLAQDVPLINVLPSGSSSFKCAFFGRGRAELLAFLSQSLHTPPFLSACMATLHLEQFRSEDAPASSSLYRGIPEKVGIPWSSHPSFKQSSGLFPVAVLAHVRPQYGYSVSPSLNFGLLPHTWHNEFDLGAFCWVVVSLVLAVRWTRDFTSADMIVRRSMNAVSAMEASGMFVDILSSSSRINVEATRQPADTRQYHFTLPGGDVPRMIARRKHAFPNRYLYIQRIKNPR